MTWEEYARGRGSVEEARLPRQWLAHAYGLAGRSAPQGPLPRRGTRASRQAWTIADVMALEDAERAYEGLLEGGARDVRRELAGVCAMKAMLHAELGDLSGSLALHRRAVSIRRELLEESPGDEEFARHLAGSHVNMANLLRALGRNEEALGLYARERAIREPQYEDQPGERSAANMIMLLANLSGALSTLGRAPEAVDALSRAVRIYRRLPRPLRAPPRTRHLAAIVHFNLAGVLVTRPRRGDEAIEPFGQAIEIWRRLVVEEGRSEYATVLASAQMNKANALCLLGRPEAALGEFARALEALEGGATEHQPEASRRTQAMICMNRAHALLAAGRIEAAVREYDRSVELWRELAVEHGRRDCLPDYAWARADRAVAAPLRRGTGTGTRPTHR